MVCFPVCGKMKIVTELDHTSYDFEEDELNIMIMIIETTAGVNG